MNAHRLTSLLAATATLAAMGATRVEAAATPSSTASKAAAKITPTGVDGVALGEPFAKLRARHLVGKLTNGCPLAGRNARSARLTAPLKGSVDFTLGAPRRVTDITVTGGGRVRGVGIGARIATIKAAFPKAKVDHSTDQMFGVTLVKLPKNGGGKLQFAVSTKTKRVVLVGIPFVPFCE